MIGVVVVSHESATDLPACLEALQRAGGVVQIVVVDNASTDGSPELVAAAGDARLELVRAPRNLGFAGGCNLGLAHLDGGLPTVAFMNPDVSVTADCLERCAALLESEPQTAGLAPRLMRPDGRTVDSVGQLLSPHTLEVRDIGYGQPWHAALARPRPVLAPCGALAVYRRGALDEVAEADGPWAQHYFCFWEDLELGWRLVNRGWSITSAPDAVAVHGRGAGARRGGGPLRWRRSARLEACILSNRWMTLIRHLHIRDLLRRFPRLVLWDAAMTGAGLVRRPVLARHLAGRLPLVWREWRRRATWPRRRLGELPW